MSLDLRVYTESSQSLHTKPQSYLSISLTKEPLKRSLQDALQDTLFKWKATWTWWFMGRVFLFVVFSWYCRIQLVVLVPFGHLDLYHTKVQYSWASSFLWKVMSSGEDKWHRTELVENCVHIMHWGNTEVLKHFRTGNQNYYISCFKI